MMMETRKFATVEEIIKETKGGGGTVDQQLMMLFDKFSLAVRSIDPTVKGAWIGRDGPNMSTPAFIVFERPGSYFRRPA